MSKNEIGSLACYARRRFSLRFQLTNNTPNTHSYSEGEKKCETHPEAFENVIALRDVEFVAEFDRAVARL